MSRTIKPKDLSAAIAEELTTYHKDVMDKVNAAGETAVKSLVKKTKATAPVRTGRYKRSITWTEIDNGSGDKKYIWHVKAPHHRLTHLLAHGHATPTGGRTKADPFLKNAVDQVLPVYEKEVKEALEK